MLTMKKQKTKKMILDKEKPVDNRNDVREKGYMRKPVTKKSKEEKIKEQYALMTKVACYEEEMKDSVTLADWRDYQDELHPSDR